jgi:hypothetical protein
MLKWRRPLLIFKYFRFFPGELQSNNISSQARLIPNNVSTHRTHGLVNDGLASEVADDIGFFPLAALVGVDVATDGVAGASRPCDFIMFTKSS